MQLPQNKTKIVCTIGPACDSPEVMEEMILAGMNVARINFAHGDLAGQQENIRNLRAAARAAGRRLAVMADLPGPKIRIGFLAREPVELKTGGTFTLSTEETVGDESRASVNFPLLHKRVKPGDVIFLNDGFIQLECVKVRGPDVECRIVAGGELRSRKGLNLPGIDLEVPAFTERDRGFLKFALEQGVDAVSQSFVESGADVAAVRSAAAEFGFQPFIIAKIERSRALDRMDSILHAADGIMIARGDLGVEIPIEKIALVQKQVMEQANMAGRPVITATQMLESMTETIRPTRAEVTDVANAILDGTDCVMLSEESALGKYPVQAVAMLAKIAAVIEPHRPAPRAWEVLKKKGGVDRVRPGDVIALSVEAALQCISPSAVFTPTRSGNIARSIARFRPAVWIAAVSVEETTCQGLQFSYGVFPVREPDLPEDWKGYAREWMRAHEVAGNLFLLTGGPSPKHPEANHRLEIIDLGNQ